MKVVTNDLYCGAYILSKGGALEEIKVNRNKIRPTVLFIFTGPDVFNLQKEFISGKANVNLKDFKASMIHLKDQMFSTLRNEKGDERYEKRSART